MKKLLLAILVLVSGSVSADTLSTNCSMESTFVYQSVRYVSDWQQASGAFPWLAVADSTHWVSPTYSLFLQGQTPWRGDVHNHLILHSVNSPGTFVVHLNAKVKRENGNSSSIVTWMARISGMDSLGRRFWENSGSDTLTPLDTLWHSLSRDLLTIQLMPGDSIRFRDTTSVVYAWIAYASGNPAKLFLDDVYVTGEFSPNGVEETEVVRPMQAVHLRPGLYDLLGRRVDRMSRSGIYFVVGVNGSRKKVIHLR